MNKGVIYDKKAVEAIAWLRFPLIMCVVFWHNNIYALVERLEGVAPDCPAWLIYIFDNLHHIVLPAPVPVLFMISGYLFFRNSNDIDRNFFLEKYKRRAHSLLIPYLVWNLIAIVILYIRFNIVAKEGYTVTDYLSGFWDFTQREGNDPANGPLWYMRDLMVVILSTPLLYLLLKRKAVAYIYLFLFATCYAINNKTNIANIECGSFFFFSIGAFAALHKKDITKIPGTAGITALILYIPIQLIANHMNGSSEIFLITTVTKTTALLYLTTLLFEKKILKPAPALEKTCFTLYAIHGIIIGPVMALLYTLFKGSINSPLLLLAIYLTTPAIILGFSFTINKIMQKYTPGLARIVTGNRG